MEAYKELFRHPRNEEKRQELISCFQKVWTVTEIFGRLRDGTIQWNLTPHREFLPAALKAWNAPPIRLNRLSPSPDPEAKFAARPDLPEIIDDFIQDVMITTLKGVRMPTSIGQNTTLERPRMTISP